VLLPNVSIYDVLGEIGIEELIVFGLGGRNEFSYGL
jgi:hypothetical protein